MIGVCKRLEVSWIVLHQSLIKCLTNKKRRNLPLSCLSFHQQSLSDEEMMKAQIPCYQYILSSFINSSKSEGYTSNSLSLLMV